MMTVPAAGWATAALQWLAPAHTDFTTHGLPETLQKLPSGLGM